MWISTNASRLLPSCPDAQSALPTAPGRGRTPDPSYLPPWLAGLARHPDLLQVARPDDETFSVHFSAEAGRELLDGRVRSKGHITCAPDRRPNASIGVVVPGFKDHAISICWSSTEKRRLVFAVRTQGAHRIAPAGDSSAHWSHCQSCSNYRLPQRLTARRIAR